MAVEVAVEVGGVREQHAQLQGVALDLQLRAGHVVQHLREPANHELWMPHGEVARSEVDRRMLLRQPVHVRGQT
jgi:hypothetical protein